MVLDARIDCEELSHTIGVNYRKIWNQSSFSNTSISQSNQRADAQFLDYNSGSITSMANNQLKSSSIRQINQTSFSNNLSSEITGVAKITSPRYAVCITRILFTHKFKVQVHYKL